MRYIMYLFVFLLASPLCGQRIERIAGRFVVKTEADTIRFRVDSAQGGQFFVVSRADLSSALSDAIKDCSIEMKKGNMIFTLKTEKGDFSNQSYAIDPVIEGPINLHTALPRAMVVAGKPTVLSWADATEQGFYPGQEYDLRLKTTLLGDTDCAAGPPRLKLNGPILGSAALLAGGGIAVGIGQQLKVESQNKYETYLDAWEAGRPQQDETDALFEQAEDDASRSESFTEVGVGASVIGGAILLYFWAKAAKKKQQYKKYCDGNSASGNSSLDFSMAGGVPGLKLVKTF